MTNQNSGKNDCQNTPETGAEWYALIRPAIDVSPYEANASDVVAAAKRHAEQVIERTEMDVNLDNITWQASWELKVKHGYQRTNRVKLSLHSLETNGWQTLMRIVRHELIHIWQYQHDEYTSGESTKFARAHGASFEQWMPVLNVSKYGPGVLGTWTVECPSCHTVIERIKKRRKNQIGRFIHSTESVTCQDCETDVSEYLVKRQGEQVDIEPVPEPSRPVSSDRQKSVSLSNETEERTGPADPDSGPQTRSLTDLTGVGDTIAVALGDRIQVIEDLVAQDGGLAEEVLASVSPEYHDALRDDVIEWYSDALFHRGEDDPERFDHVVSKLKSEQGQPSECSDDVDGIKAMCRTLRNAIEPGDGLELTFEEDGNCTVQVEQKYIENPTILGVSVQAGPTTVSSDVMVYVPAPSKGDFPFLKDKRQAEGEVAGEHLYRIVERKIVGIERR